MIMYKWARGVVVASICCVIAVFAVSAPAYASDWTKSASHCVQVGTSDPGSCGTVVYITRYVTRSDPTQAQLRGEFAPYGETVWVTSGGMFNFRFRLHIQGEATTDWKTFDASQVCVRWGGGPNDGCQQLAGRDIAEGKQVLLEQCLFDTDRQAWVCHTGQAVA